MTSAALSDRPRLAAAKAPPARRLVLVRSESRTARDKGQVRRYRLARLRLEPREVRGEDRFAHLREPHD